MEFPNAPFEPVPINGFSYPTVSEIEAHVQERAGGEENLMRMWIPDQIWTQNVIEREHYGYAQEWPAWANSLITNSHRPDGSTMTGGRAFQGAVLLANDNSRRLLSDMRRVDAR